MLSISENEYLYVNQELRHHRQLNKDERVALQAISFLIQGEITAYPRNFEPFSELQIGHDMICSMSLVSNNFNKNIRDFSKYI